MGFAKGKTHKESGPWQSSADWVFEAFEIIPEVYAFFLSLKILTGHSLPGKVNLENSFRL
jgi:hypothetical protein